MSTAILRQFEAKDFMGIDSKNGVIIEFPKNKPVTKLKGDQGTGKTSTITALMYLMGAAFDIDTKNFTNMTDDKIDIKLDFEYQGEGDSAPVKYEVTATSSRLSLKKYFKEAGKFISVGEPKATLRTIFGNLGVSPMFLREMDGKKQIKWFQETFGDADGKVAKKEADLRIALKELESARREANREVKALKGSLDVDPMYQDYEKSEKKYGKALDVKKEEAKVQELSSKREEFLKTKAGLEALQTNFKDQQRDIAELEEKLTQAKQKAAVTQERVTKGLEYVKANASIEVEYNTANTALQNLSRAVADHKQWKDILRKEAQYNELLDAAQMADAKVDELRGKILELVEKYLPKVPGLEIRMKVAIDDEDEGIYYQDKTLAQLSESELWDLFIDHIWPNKDVYFIFCENISSLGSNAVATMNRLVKEKKAHIIASEMDREKDEMEIIYANKVD